MKVAKSHTRYKLPDGTRVPGVTTVINQQLGWNKQALIKWANNLGLRGQDSTKYRDETAAIGRLAHEIITKYLAGKAVDYADFSKNQIDAAENAALSFFEWAKNKKIEPILVEKPFVNLEWNVGGQADIVAKIDGRVELIDLKTGKAEIYHEQVVQIAAYFELLKDCQIFPKRGGKYKPLKIEVDVVRILNIPRTEDEDFGDYLVSETSLQKGWAIFRNCLENYQLLSGWKIEEIGEKK